MRLPAGRSGRRRDEDGAVVPFVAVVMVVLLLVAALATDLGLQRVARADMQSVADAVALDLSRELDGRDEATLAPLMPALAAASRERNDSSIGDDATISVELGELDDQGDFEAVAGAEVPSAVRVTARTEVDFAFGGITGTDDGAAQRSAVGVADVGACFRVGSFVASVNSSSSPLLNVLLGTLLGSTVNLTAVGYQGLADAEVTLLELVEVGGLGVGTTTDLLALDGLSVADFYLAVARVLTQQGDAVAATLLESVPVAASTPTIAIGDLLTASASDAAAVAARLNVLDLVTGAAYLAHEGATLAIPALGVTLPGVGSVGASLTVTEAPQAGCGGPGTRASTAQVRLSVPISVPGGVVAVPGVGNVTLGATSLTLLVDLGHAIATMLDITCGTAGATALDLRLASEVVGQVTLTGSTGVSATVGVPLASGLLTTVLRVLGLSVLPAGLPTISLTTTTSLAAGTLANPYSTDVSLPLPASYSVPVGSASGVVLTGLTAQVDSGTTVRLSVPQLLGAPRTYTYSTGDLFDAVVDPILTYLTGTVVTPVLTALQTGVVTPLADLLGIQLAGADVWAMRQPSCAGPRLRQ